MSPFSSFGPASEAAEVGEDVERLFDELARSLPEEARAGSGEYRPPLDVLETERQIDIVVDVPGVSLAAVRVAYRSGVLIVLGEKAPARDRRAQAYHLVEREFGRFVRAIRVTGAVDVGSARARLANGELSIALPKIAERRGRVHTIPVDDDTAPAS